MTFSGWRTLLEELDALSESATLVTPLSHDWFHVTDIQEHCVVIEFGESNKKRTLQYEKFETLFQQVWNNGGRVDLNRVSPDSDPFLAVMSLHPRFEIDEDAGVIVETDEPTSSLILEGDTLDARDVTLERLEMLAREWWDDKWAIRAIHFADGTTQAYAYRSHSIVDDDRDAKTLEEERLYTDGEQTFYRRVHVHREHVVDVCEEREINGRALEE